MKVIDFRVRPPLKSFLRCAFYNDGAGPFAWHSPRPPAMLEKSFPRFREEMAQAGIVSAVVWGRETEDAQAGTSNDDVAAIVAEHRDIFIAGFGGLCPRAGREKEALAEIQRAARQLGLVGISLEPGLGMRPLRTVDDPFLYPVYECLQGLGMILGVTVSRGGRPEQTLRYSDPEALDRVARDFPDLKIVISHACWPWVEQSCGLAFRRPNVYLHPDLYGMAMPGHLLWVEAANTFLQDRMLFGTAYPYLGLKEMVDAYLKLPYRDSVRERVMYKNALRLLGLRED